MSYFLLTDHSSCSLATWITNSEKESRIYTNTTQWNLFKKSHELFHAKVQAYIDLNSNKVDNKVLKQSAKEIEEITIDIFNRLNDIAVVNTEFLREVS